MVEFLIFALLGIGAIASGGFFVLYMKSADLRNPVTRQVLALNAGIAGVLFLAIARRLGYFGDDFILYIQMFLFVFIDFALVYQFVMLYRARRQRAEDKLSRERSG